MSNLSVYKKYKDITEEYLLHFIPEIDPLSKDLYEIMKYALTAGGKRIRPVLVLAGCEMFNIPMHFAIPNAIAAEYIHTYSLVHDDLPCMDDDDFRRGKPTVHKEYGEAMAVLAGDALLSCAFEVLSKDMLIYLDDPILLKRKIRAFHILSKGSGTNGMISGQVSDVLSSEEECSEELLKYINYNKTASLIRACVLSGGYLGGMDEDTRLNLSVYGENIGLAFQLADDIEDAKSGQDIDKTSYIKLIGVEKTISLASEYIQKARSAVEKYFDHAAVYNYLADFLEETINGQ